MAGLGRAPSAAAEEGGRASRGNFRESEDVADAADFGFPIFGERMMES